jgi:hypothetical protein
MSTIKAFDIVGTNAISLQSGTKLYKVISPVLLQKNDLVVDFDNVTLFASPFFNASIGLLLKTLTIEELQQHLKPINLSDVGKELLNLVLANAIDFYSNDKRISDALDNSSVNLDSDD